ncbi:MAG: ABC transporter permease [Acidimicrobiales bacterium]
MAISPQMGDEARVATAEQPVAQGTRAAANRRIRVPWRLFAWYGASVVLLVAVWQALGHAFGIVFVPFSTTIVNFWTLVRTGVMGSALLTSGKVFGAGLGLCLVIGVVLGLLLARVRLLSAAIEPYVYLLYAMPTITLVPFVFAAFGFGFWPQVLITVLIAIFPVVIGVAEGARSIPQELLDVAASYRTSEPQLWRHVIVPYVVPHAMSGVKQTIALTLVGTLVAEFFLNATGVAALLVYASNNVKPAELLSVTLMISILAIVLVGIGEAIQRYFTKWL